MNGSTIYENRYIKTKIKTYGNKVYSNFCGLNVPQGGIEFEYFTVISTDSLLLYENKYFLQIYSEIMLMKLLKVDYLGDNPFELV